MPNSRWQAVLFDFDYTLADSSPGIIACANYALGEMHLPQEGPERIRSTIGLALTETFTRLTGSVDPRQREAFARLFVHKADEVMVASTTLYDAARAVIPLLDDAGYLLGVVSTKYRDRLEGVLRREGLLQHMRVVVGGDQAAQPKPAPDGLLLAAAALKLKPTACLYVGDTPIDAQAAA
ncbi:MAG: HAD family hydrolase, partial [Chloroflexi bacterium]|nr:HAD family hydrolase [Chloroflexota bacterium]